MRLFTSKIKQNMPIEILRKFFRLKSAAGILLLLAAIAAIVVENSFLSDSYSKLLHSSISFKISASSSPEDSPFI